MALSNWCDLNTRSCSITHNSEKVIIRMTIHAKKASWLIDA